LSRSDELKVGHVVQADQTRAISGSSSLKGPGDDAAWP